MLSALKVGQPIEYECKASKMTWSKHRGKIQQITDRHIAIQCAKYPDSIPICDLVSGLARITEPAMDFSGYRMERRQREEGAEMVNQKYDWDTYGPRVVAMLGEGMGIPAIARELDYPYYAVRDYIGRKVKSKPVDSPHPASVPPLHPETCNALGADIQATEMRRAVRAQAEVEANSVVLGISMFPIQDSGERREFETGAVRDIQENKGRYDLIPWEAIHELALHCEAGALKYGERNAELGIPIHSFIDSAMRHLSCYLRGMNDEPHLRASLWNIAFAIWTEKNMPDMQDIPARKGYV